jgi:hypothetical protein
MTYPGFQEAYENLRKNQLIDFQDEALRRTGWSLSTFNNKKAGRTKIFKCEIPMIQSLFRKYGIHLMINSKETVLIQ